MITGKLNDDDLMQEVTPRMAELIQAKKCLDWLEEKEASLIPSRHNLGDGEYEVWWTVIKRKKSLSGHPKGCPVSAIECAISSQTRKR